MTFLLVASLFAQYVDAYAPHKSLYVESGTLVSTHSAEIGLAYAPSEEADELSSPVMSRFAFSPDGYNELGIELPWVKVVTDTATNVFLGNMKLSYKRRILASLDWGYLAAKLEAGLPTSPDEMQVRGRLGGNHSHYSLTLAYTYELPLLEEYHDFFGNLPLVGTAALADRFLDWNHETGEGEFGTALGWGLGLDILPVDYAFLGASIQGGDDGFGFGPHLGFRWYWFDAGVAWRMGGDSDRFDFHLRFYL
jgi:hypothetical protein